MNRAQARNDQPYNDPTTLLEELIKVNKEIVLADRLHPIHEIDIRRAFRHRFFSQGVPFIRGDADLSQKIDVSDAIRVLGFLFGGLGRLIDCQDAMDADDNGRVQITDAIYLLRFLFLGARPPVSPHAECGIDPTPDDTIGCVEFSCPL